MATYPAMQTQVSSDKNTIGVPHSQKIIGELQSTYALLNESGTLSEADHKAIFKAFLLLKSPPDSQKNWPAYQKSQMMQFMRGYGLPYAVLFALTFIGDNIGLSGKRVTLIRNDKLLTSHCSQTRLDSPRMLQICDSFAVFDRWACQQRGYAPWETCRSTSPAHDKQHGLSMPPNVAVAFRTNFALTLPPWEKARTTTGLEAAAPGRIAPVTPHGFRMLVAAIADAGDNVPFIEVPEDVNRRPFMWVPPHIDLEAEKVECTCFTNASPADDLNSNYGQYVGRQDLTAELDHDSFLRETLRNIKVSAESLAQKDEVSMQATGAVHNVVKLVSQFDAGEFYWDKETTKDHQRRMQVRFFRRIRLYKDIAIFALCVLNLSMKDIDRLRKEDINNHGKLLDQIQAYLSTRASLSSRLRAHFDIHKDAYESITALPPHRELQDFQSQTQVKWNTERSLTYAVLQLLKRDSGNKIIPFTLPVAKSFYKEIVEKLPGAVAITTPADAKSLPYIAFSREALGMFRHG